MKKLIFLLFLPMSTLAQTELAYNNDIGMAEVQQVIEAPGQTTAELYQKVNNWIVQTYKNPERVISGRIESEMIKGNGAGSDINFGSLLPEMASFTYAFQVDIKDGKVRYTMNDISLRGDTNHFTAEQLTFKYDGSPKTGKFARRVKGDIEAQANHLIDGLKNFLLNSSQAQNDDW